MSRPGPERDRRSSGLGIGAAGIGAVLFLLLHVFFALTWERLFPGATLETPWFLGSSRSIVATQVTLGLAAAIGGLRQPAWRERFRNAGLLTFGALAAAAVVFFALGPARLMVGPTDLWPVVLTSAFLLLAPAALAGTLLGGYVRSVLAAK